MIDIKIIDITFDTINIWISSEDFYQLAIANNIYKFGYSVGKELQCYPVMRYRQFDGSYINIKSL